MWPEVLLCVYGSGSLLVLADWSLTSEEERVRAPEAVLRAAIWLPFVVVAALRVARRRRRHR